MARETMLQPLGALTPPPMVGFAAELTLLSHLVGCLVIGALLVLVRAFTSLAIPTGPATSFTCMTETLTIMFWLRAVFGHVARPLTIVAHVLLLGAVYRHMSWLPTMVTTRLSDVVNLLGVSFTTCGVVIDLHTPDVSPA